MRSYARSGRSGKPCSGPSPGPSPGPDTAASSSGSPPWPSTSRSTPSPSRSLAIDRPADWKALESFAEYGSWRADLVTRAPGPARREGPRPDLARLPRLGRRRHQGPPHQQGRLGHLHLPRVHRPLPQPRHHRPAPQLGRPRGLAAQPRPARLVPARSPAGSTSASRSCPPGRATGPEEVFRTKCELLVELLREQARVLGGQAPGRLRRRLRRWRAWSGRWSRPRTARPASSS